MNHPSRKRRIALRLGIASFIVLAIGLSLPERCLVPVEGATSRDWNPDAFWYEPWGKSGVHKGIDIFAVEGRPVVAATSGLVVYRGEWSQGGNVVLVLGPKWRIHYYAHLSRFADEDPWLVHSGERLGDVGRTGNAANKPPHLHYSVVSLVPLPWRITRETQGWKRMFYLDPDGLLAPRHD
ncbi:M23 family metallopeptidase [Arenimonas sp.]|uniref:M23 family metallopeptidase n=1 Tax=Arenimonas sp. TaxID=1872635 RepID=UPI0039E3F98D